MDELTALAAEAQATDAAGAPPPTDQPQDTAQAAPPAPISPRDEAHGLLTFAVTAIAPLYPCIGRIYTDEQIARLADVTGPLMAKYNVTASGLFEKWAVEFNFAVVAVPIALETVRAIRAENAALRAARAKEVKSGSENRSTDATDGSEEQRPE